ncbi:hypothetical protein ACJRW5_19185 [Pseudomonas sp. SH1-B]
MKRRTQRSVGLRLLRATSSLALIGAGTYVAVAGFNMLATLVLVSSFGSILAPAVISAESTLECVAGFFEILLDGVLSIFEMIGNVVSSIFG